MNAKCGTVRRECDVALGVAILAQLAKRTDALDPVLAKAISMSFDEAAILAESLSGAKGKAGGPLPETLRIIKQLSTAVTGGQKLRHGL